SQFASALLLNSWNLPFPLRIQWHGPFVSESYFQMSEHVTRQAGMNWHQDGAELHIPAQQSVSLEKVMVEPDMSSVFAVAALAAVAGEARIESFPGQSLQPDFHFVEILKQM